MPGIWDDLMKMLVGANPQAFVSLILPGAVFEHERSQELRSRTLVADLLYTVTWLGVPTVLHTEIQRRRDGKMGKRLWEYNVVTTVNSQLPVCTIVLYLKKDGNVVESPYTAKLANEEVNHVFYYRVIKLWEIPTELFKQVGLEGMLPLLPLTKAGAQREVVEEMITDLKGADKNDLLPFAYAFAALVFENEADQDWLKRRFTMLKDVLEDSWAYQEMKQQGWAEGREQGLEQGREQGLARTLVSFVQKRFPDLLPLAQQQTVVLKDSGALQHMLDELFAVQSAEEAKKTLSLGLKPKRRAKGKESN